MNHKETLRLPRASFPLRISPAQQEAAVLGQWREQRLYERRQQLFADAPALCLHDGPPYTYHEPQLGDAFNKILKDVWARASHMLGRRCDFVPGWDCHGLPVAVEVEARLGAQKDELSPVAFRAACRAYVQESIAIQQDLFERLGVLAAWDEAYQTMSPSYEAALMRSLATMVREDALVWRHQPVHWCGACATALASFEISYKRTSSPSMYIGYPLISDPMGLERVLRGRDVEVVVWTTSPWRMPGNVAIGIAQDAAYVAIRVQRRIYIVAEDSLEATAKACGWGNQRDIVAQMSGQQLVGHRCRHPLIHRELPLLASARVDPAMGSGCVQIAPGHNVNDFTLAQEADLELYCPLDTHGCFMPHLGRWAGVHFSEVGTQIARQLQDWGALLNDSRQQIDNYVPHCRRCQKPSCQRSAPLWFLSMSEGGLRERAMEAVQQVNWQPPWMEQQMLRQLQHRSDWCLSRQRKWGVPLPVFYCKRCDRPWLDAAMIDTLANVYEEHPNGADAWYERTADELLEAANQSPRCPRCFLKEFRKEADVFDVWFEAGASFLTRTMPSDAAMTATADTEERVPAPFDLYLESTRQLQSWLQSALLASVLLQGQAPYREVRGHAQVTKARDDAHVEHAPDALLALYGADVLRLWVALEHEQHAHTVSPTRLEQYQAQLQQLRGMCRFLLGNADGVSVEQWLPLEALCPLEQAGVLRLQALREFCCEAFAKGSYRRVWHEVMSFVGAELSRFACEVLKERWYCEAPDALTRRSAQTFALHCVETLAQVIAPICCFLAEEIWSHLPARQQSIAPLPALAAGQIPGSVHLTLLPQQHKDSAFKALGLSWETLRQLRALASASREAQLDPATPAGTAMGLELLCDAKALMEQLQAWPEDTLAEVLGTAFLVLSEHPAKAQESTRQPRLLREQVTFAWTALDEVLCPRCRRQAGQAGHAMSYCTRCQHATEVAWSPAPSSEPI